MAGRFYISIYRLLFTGYTPEYHSTGKNTEKKPMEANEMQFLWTTVYVKDLDESIAFYSDLAELKVQRRFPAGPPRQRRAR